MSGQWKRTVWPADMARRFLYILLALFVAKQILLAFLMPAFSGHDEVAHFQNIRIIAEDHRLPKLVNITEWRQLRTQTNETVGGDFLDADLYPYFRFVLNWFHYQPGDPNYEASLTNPIHAVTFPDYSGGLDDPINNQVWPDGVDYAANHPPLFYVVSVPVYWATNWMSLETQMKILRLVAIPFGMLTVLGTFLMARWLFPGAPFVAITAAAFMAFQPQISYEAAMINNDIAVIAFATLLMAYLVRGMRYKFDLQLTSVIGILYALVLLSKGSAIIFAAPIAVMMIVSIGWQQWRTWVPRGALVAGIAFGLSAPWYLFLWDNYGNFTALQQVKDIQYNFTYTQGWNTPSVWDLFWNKGFALQRWNETWGEFGWRLIPLTQTLLKVIGYPLLVLILLFFVYFLRKLPRRWRKGEPGTIHNPESWQLWALATFVLTGVLGYAAVIQFGLTFELTQARYFFPMVAPVAILLMVGLYWAVPVRLRGYAQVTIVGLMIALNIYIFTAYVFAFWYQGFADPGLFPLR